MPWPLPALLTWAFAWVVLVVARLAGLPFIAAAGLATLVGVCAALPRRIAPTPWRMALLMLGFPVSLLAAGVAPLPAWAWLLPLGLLLLLYPLRSWRDAPLFPTPRGALAGLPAQVPMHDGARVVDAGCGLGDGLIELRQAYPRARLEGLEWSWPLRALCALRCSFARVQRADIWAVDWSAYQLVYLFQRPESMARALAKAQRELRPGAWLVSLEFAVPGLAHDARLAAVPGRPVWLYRAPLNAPAGRT
jgi:SAM-dependent methyltransferase